MGNEYPFSNFPAMKIAKINLDANKNTVKDTENQDLCTLKPEICHLSETTASMPILIANPEIQINIEAQHFLKHLTDHIIKIKWRQEKLKCDMPAQSNHLFTKGTLIANIEYVPKDDDKVLCEEAYVPFQMTTPVNLYNPPLFSPQNQSREYTFESESNEKQYKNREQIIYGPSDPFTYKHHWTHIVSTETYQHEENTCIQFQLDATISVLIFQQQLVDIT
ncbi:hypothetical protein [Scopulibacillus cellulosilyticus]|uniref:DUF3794 domain-containing protein n=1 Tax=Scopulibacillus cellulosilyticus TaxID=2665665 RepID=A0ABW2PYG5_9BACL